MSDFLLGLQYCGYAFGLLLLAIFPLPLLIQFARWVYGSKDHSEDVGAPEGDLSKHHEVTK
ncbi:hypothetical protein [Rhizobium lusitanum]|uniref:hypothetical protein n=1 Tax=Rhizobium lusitanum TaxID=293958 RepID=UPI00195A19F6|nr:hypothetical protein [Rhizobium lusitanum]MBM7049698.1 hypothetical protein [Rhizobium lusitanum]